MQHLKRPKKSMYISAIGVKAHKDIWLFPKEALLSKNTAEDLVPNLFSDPPAIPPSDRKQRTLRVQRAMNYGFRFYSQFL